ncbi:MAG: choice-of-anchor J domain-containing protein [Vicingaceae bacterium]
MLKQLLKIKLVALALLAITQTSNAQVIFSEDFNGGNALSNWTLIDNDGNTPQPNYAFFTDAWIIMNDADSTGMMDSVAASTSWYQPAGQADDYLISPQITLQPNSVLRLDAQASDAGFPDGYEVLISTTTPTITGLQANPPLLTVAAENPTWTRRNIDLSAYSGNVHIAIRNNSNDNNILFIDNILVEVSASNDDAAITDVARTSEYSRIPQNQSTNPFTFAAIVNNAGLDTLTNVKLKYELDLSGSIVYSDSSMVSFIAPGDDSLFLDQSSYVPNNLGRYQVRYTVSHDSTDAVPADNTMMSDSLVVTDSTFARDGNSVNGLASLTPGSSGEFGNVYELNTSDTLTSVSFFVSNAGGQLSGRPVYYLVRDFNNGTPGAVVASSDTIPWPAAAQNIVARLDIAQGGVVLPADSFYVSVVQADSALTLGTSTNKFSPNTALIGLNGNFVPIEGTSLGARTFFIRANFGSNALITSLEENMSVKESTSSLSVYPNPSNGLFNLILNQTNSNQTVDMQLINMSGQVVYHEKQTASELNNKAFDFKHLESGVYFVKVNAANEHIIKRLIIK